MNDESIPSGAVRVDRVDDAWIVTLHGEHDLATADDMAPALDRVFAAGSTVVVDLSQATFIDSSIVATLVRASRTAREGAHRLVVCAPRESFAQRVLGLVGAEDFLHVVGSREEALTQLRPAGG